MNTHDRFEAVNDDYIKFERVVNKKNTRPDIHAFILLSELFPNYDRDIISAAGHDEIWLDISSEEINKLTDENILDLVRCGVRYDSHHDSLSMFT
jgi:hypothetical protein